MIDFRIDDATRDLLGRVTRTVEELVYPNEHHFDPDLDWIPRDLEIQLQKEVKARGLWGAHLPTDLGGLGLTNVRLALVNEILGRSFLASRIFGTSAPDSGNTEILANFGSPEQKARWLEPLAQHDIRSVFCMTERDAGSDPTRIATTAVRDGDAWVVNGDKWYSSGADGAAVAFLMARTGPEADARSGISLFVTSTDNPGFHVVRRIPTMGYPDPGGHCEVAIRDMVIPAGDLLGEEGQGFAIAQSRLAGGRLHHCMRWVGQCQRAFDLMLERALSRETFGQRLADRQTVQDWIADSAAQMQALRLMTLHAAWKLDEGADYRKDISLIKFYGARVLHDVIDRALQVHGSLGYSQDSPLEMMYRAARAARLYDGPDEVHRMVVSRRYLKDARERLATAGAGAAEAGA